MSDNCPLCGMDLAPYGFTRGPEPETPSSLAAMPGSDAELIASKELLRRWLKKYAPSNVPGAWDYDHDAVELIETTAKLLGIEHPWRQKNH